MNYANPPRHRGWRRAVIWLAYICSIVFLPLGYVMSVLSDCPAFAPESCSQSHDLVQWALFPGLSIAFLVLALAFETLLRRESHDLNPQ